MHFNILLSFNNGIFLLLVFSIDSERALVRKERFGRTKQVCNTASLKLGLTLGVFCCFVVISCNKK